MDTAFHVYQLWFTGSDGGRQIGPLYTHRKLAQAALDAEHRSWQAAASNGCHIFGDAVIRRLPVCGSPPTLQ